MVTLSESFLLALPITWIHFILSDLDHWSLPSGCNLCYAPSSLVHSFTHC